VRIAVVGPTYPAKGGVVAHTTSLARRLAEAGHEVVLVGWHRMYPARLYPGESAAAPADPGVPAFERTVSVLRWDDPGTWWRAGRRLRSYDLVVLVSVIPAQAPSLWTVARAAQGRSRDGAPAGGRGPRVVVLAHNVVPHETHPGSAQLTRLLFGAADTVLVHSPFLAEQASQAGAGHVVVAALPPHLPIRPVAEQPEHVAADGRVRLLAWGIVRDYKGVDLLLQAAAFVPEVQVTVAGELWGEAGERVRAAAADARLAGRVRLREGFVPGDELPDLLAQADVLTLTYRHATASQNVTLAHAHGLPVLATRVGTFGEQVRDGVDGLLVPPDDVAAVVAALRRLAEPGTLDRLRAGVPEVDLDGPWAAYLQTLTARADQLGTDQPGTDQPGTDQPGTDQPGTDQPGDDRGVRGG
jgi:glycosyltransferase involved in cell wall biosynthesis